MRDQQTKSKRGCLRGCLIATLVTVTVLVFVGGMMARFGGFGTGPSANPDEFAQYAASVSDLTVPEGTRIVALGEATHGNREFQELKLDVFKVLVEKYGMRAFALEADAGGCEAANRYIHGGEGTAEQAAKDLIFTIYRTDQMAELLSWMRTYNETAAQGQDLRFYGFDMQSYEYSYGFLLEEARRLGIDTEGLEQLWDGEGYVEGLEASQKEAAYEEVKQQIIGLGDGEDTSLALHLIDCLQQNAKLSELFSSPEGTGLRDDLMAQNVLWILDQEERLGNQMVFISAHNGHIEQEGSYYGLDMKVMGNLLADELGDAYYAIGTDFHKAEVNLPKGDGRMTHTFYSYDPLAKAAARCGYETCWLDFSRVLDSSELAAHIHEPILMGSVGEGFTPIMYVLPQSYRIKQAPDRLYDSIIFVPDAHPTVILPR